MANKRKRDELSDSDLEEITPGKQNLPVANLPYDFDQEPQDGMQYLFLVRRDARRLPHITRVKNPYEVLETNVVHTPPPLSTNTLPCEEWRVAFQTHFSNLRKNVAQATIHVDGHSSSTRRVIPEKKDRDAWWKFLSGYPESTWSQKDKKKLSRSRRMRALADPTEAVFFGNTTSLQDVQSRDGPSHLPAASLYDLPRQPSSPGTIRSAESTNAASLAVELWVSEEAQEGHIERLLPPEVTPSHLREIDHRMSIHLLMYFTHWINIHLQNPNDAMATISVSHGRWIFALLTKIDDELSADEMSLLRNLARACVGLIQSREGEGAKKNAVSEGDSCHVLAENRTHMSDATCWMVFAAIAGHWGQRDLWGDAGAALARA